MIAVRVGFTFVRDVEPDAFIEEGEFPQPGAQGIVMINRAVEDGIIRKKGDRCSRAVRRTGFTNRIERFAAFIFLLEDLAFAMYHDFQMRRQRVHTGNTDSVQTTGYFVAVLVELTTGVQDGEHDFQRAAFLLGVDVGRDTTSVVDDGDGIIGVNEHLDVLAKPANASSIELSTTSYTR